MENKSRRLEYISVLSNRKGCGKQDMDGKKDFSHTSTSSQDEEKNLLSRVISEILTS